MERDFWSGFVAGAAVGAGGVMLANLLGREQHRHIVRLEKSIQIGKPTNEVYEAWSRLETLPGMSSVIDRIERQGERSHWVVNVGGGQLEWDAVKEQDIPGQAIGWKSVTGTKHTGRVNFSPVGDDCMVHVTMNYAPPGNFWTRPFVQQFEGKIENWIEQVLREFKASLEGKGTESSTNTLRMTSRTSPTGQPLQNEERATGTTGRSMPNTGAANPLGLDAVPEATSVEFTRPPDRKA